MAENDESSNGCQGFHSELNEFRKQSVLTDVIILSDDNQTLPAHSLVLAAGSEILKSTFTVKQASVLLQKQAITLQVDGISSQIWDLILDFLYMRRLTVPFSVDMLSSLFVSAKRLGIKNLVSSLGSLMMSMSINFDLNSKLDAVKIKLCRQVYTTTCNQGVQVNMDNDGFPPLYVQPKPNSTITVEQSDQDVKRVDNEVGSISDACDEYVEIMDSNDDNLSDNDTAIRKPIKSVSTTGKKIKKYECANHQCGQVFNNTAELVEHHYDCILAESSYRIADYFTINESGRLVYSDPFVPTDESNAVEAPFATVVENRRKSKGKRGHRYKCGHCDVIYTLPRIARHLASVHGKRKPFRCKLCPQKWYNDHWTFMDHYLDAHTSTRFTCKYCSEQFGKRDQLTRHILLEHKHMGEKNYACKVCGKKFKRPAHARRHEAYHKPIEERRKHQCAFCGKKYLTVFDLRKHEQIHSKTKPFQCSQCDYRTVRRAYLHLHERTHGIITANYICVTCGRYYLAEHAFKSHLEESGHEGKHVKDLTEKEHAKVIHLSKTEASAVKVAQPKDDSFELRLKVPTTATFFPIAPLTSQSIEQEPASPQKLQTEIDNELMLGNREFESLDQADMSLDAIQLEQLTGIDDSTMEAVKLEVTGQASLDPVLLQAAEQRNLDPLDLQPSSQETLDAVQMEHFIAQDIEDVWTPHNVAYVGNVCR